MNQVSLKPRIRKPRKFEHRKIEFSVPRVNQFKSISDVVLCWRAGQITFRKSNYVTFTIPLYKLLTAKICIELLPDIIDR